MPFSFSHPAIVIPFHKWFSLTGLIIGSISPDFEYFIRMKLQNDFSHTFLGIFLFNLPLSILIAFIVHNIIKNPFINNSPYFVKSRIENTKDFKWNTYFIKNWFVVILSIILGAYSHLFWDSFTHETGYFVQIINLLQSDFQNIPVFKILQHLSTFLGGLFIFYSFLKLPKNNKTLTNINFNYWFSIILLSLLIISLTFLLSSDSFVIGNIIVTSVFSIFISLTFVSFFYKILTNF